MGHWIKFRVNLMLAVGVLLVIATLLAELLPDTSKGIGPLQIYVLVLGISICAVSQLHINWLKLWSHGWIQKSIITAVSLILGLIAIEGALSILRYTPIYSSNPHPAYTNNLNCTMEHGCLWDRECRFDADLCPGYRYISERWFQYLNVNWADWYEATLNTNDYKILVTGDSFTAGASSDVGHSWVESMYAQVTTAHDNVTVWNTAVGGTGTGQAWATARYFTSLTDVDAVLLGFYASNDYLDNLYPIDFRISILDERGVPQVVNRYKLDENFQAVPLTEAELYYRVRGLEYIPTGLEALLYRTRIGSILGRRILVPSGGRPEGYLELATESTRNYLTQLRAVTIEQDVPLIILLIPSRRALTPSDEQYEIARALFDELAIPYIDVLPLLDNADYAQRPDVHWSNAGHGKAADIMASCVLYMIENQSATCPDAIVSGKHVVNE